MKKTLRSYLISIMICVFAVVLALGVMTACGGDEGENEGGGTNEPTYKVTLSLAGGTLDSTEFSLHEGDDLYTELLKHVPTKTGYEFGKWTLNGADVAEGAKMPAADTTLTAVWKSPVAVTVYTLDFEHYDVYDEGTTSTVYAYAGETLTAESLVPEHYELNEELTETLSVTVPETTDAAISLHVDPLYTRYSDVFDSSDYLYELEAEEGVLYLDRVEMREGRKKSTSYDPATGAFSFKTGEEQDSFVLEGVISGEKFYYYRDTINQTFADYLDTDASLKIESKDSVTYTPAGGQPQTGKYTVDAARGVYVFAPTTGDPMEFVLIESAGILYFRLHDGVEGWYAYDGELYGGGWALLHFDGFGIATYVDDETGTEDLYGEETGPIEYEYVHEGNGIINVYELGLVKVTDGTHEDVGGYKVSGTFINSDGLEGEYHHVNGGRDETLTLDGFGGATWSVNVETEEDTVGTYAVKADESWLVEQYDMYSGYYADYYGYVNKYLVYTTAEGSTTYLLSEGSDDEGGTTLSFEEYKESVYDVVPGVHELKATEDGTYFTCLGTNYPADKDHDAFLYFYTDETVALWYGEYDEDEEAFIYEQIVYGEWYDYYKNLYDDAANLYFEDMADGGSFTFDHEESSQTDGYTFYTNEEGKLYMDGLGKAWYLAAGADAKPVAVEYEVVEDGLIYVFEFTFPAQGVPTSVPKTYVLYGNYYDYSVDEEDFAETIYDETEVKFYKYVGYDDPHDGALASIVVVDGMTFLGIWVEYYADATHTSTVFYIEYVYAGTSTPVDGAEGEYSYEVNEDIYYDALEDYEYYYDLEPLYAFHYKVTDDTFVYGDGVKLNLTNAAKDTLVTDGYGTATLTEGGKATTGTYEVDYDLLTFIPKGAEELPDEEFYDSIRYFHIDTEKNTFVDTADTDEEDIKGYYYAAVLDETGSPENFYTDDTLFLNGAGSFIYEVYDYDEDSYTTYTGTYALSEDDDPDADYYLVDLTFDEDDVREVRLYFVSYNDSPLGLYAFRNDALLGEYTAYYDDGTKLGTLSGGEGYYEEDGVFYGEQDGEEFGYDGYMARGFIDDTDYSVTPQFTADKKGDVVIFVTYDEKGMTQFVFDIDEKDPTKVVWREKFYGAVGEYDVKGGHPTGNYLYLDGHSVATYHKEDGTEVAGTYEYVETLENTYAFKNEAGVVQFLFKPTSMTFGGMVISVYYQYIEDEDVFFVNDDWSIFYMDGFGSVAYVDKYGVGYGGECYRVTEDYDVYCLKVEGTTDRIYFELDFEHKSFNVLGDEEFLVRGDVLLLYFGSDESIKIPDGVHTIAGRAFALSGSSNIKHINFNEVTTLEEYALNGMWALEEVVSDKILKVGPSAFVDTKTIVRVELPNCTEIGDMAFYNCNGIEYVKLGKIQKIGAYAFSRDVNWCSAWTLDLTEVADISKVEIDFTAFLALKGYFKIVNDIIMVDGSKILVSGGLEGLNAAAAKLKGKTVSVSYHDVNGAADDPNKEGVLDVDLTPYLALPAPEEDPADGLMFYDLKTDAVLAFEGGLVSVYTAGDWSYELSKSYPYYIDKDGKAVLFSKDATGAYKADLTIDVSATSVTLDGKTYLKSGSTGTITASVNGKTVVVTYKSEVTSSLYVSTSVTGVSYDGTALEADDYYYSYDGVLEFSAGNHYFTAEMENGEFKITDHGEEIVVEDKSQVVWFRMTLLKSAEGTYTLKELQYNEKGTRDPEAYSVGTSYCSPKAGEENVWSFTQSTNHYTLTLTIAADALTLTAVNDGSVFTTNGLTITLKVNADLTIETILEIKKGSDTIDLKNLTYAEDKKSAKLVLEEETYVIKVSAYEYPPYFNVTATKVNYDTTETGLVFDDDYNMFSVAAKVHIDEDGNFKIVEITKFEDYSDDTPIPYSSTTQNADGSITLHLNDGRHAKITASMGSSYITFTIEWVEA